MREGGGWRRRQPPLQRAQPGRTCRPPAIDFSGGAAGRTAGLSWDLQAVMAPPLSHIPHRQHRVNQQASKAQLNFFQRKCCVRWLELWTRLSSTDSLDPVTGCQMHCYSYSALTAKKMFTIIREGAGAWQGDQGPHTCDGCQESCKYQGNNSSEQWLPRRAAQLFRSGYIAIKPHH